jgi:nitroreductase
MDKKKILEAFDFRFASKDFEPEKKISEKDFKFILETGRLSPSSFGWEPWKFLVIQNSELREKLKEFSWGAQKQLPNSSHFVLIMARKAPSFEKGSEYLKHIVNNVKQLPKEVQTMIIGFFEEFKKSDFNLDDDRKLFDWSSKQTYIPLANMMTSAALIGIDSCPIEGFNREKVENILETEQVIDTKEFGLSVMVAFGYRSQEQSFHPKTRREEKEVIQWIK